MSEIITLVTPLTIHGRLAPPDPGCAECNHDSHRCPGCGEWLYHGTACCPQCIQEVRRGER